MRRGLCTALLALAVAPPASAHVDGPMQLGLEWPASGTVTTPFGWTEGRYHPGLDIGSLDSLTVRAAAPPLPPPPGGPGKSPPLVPPGKDVFWAGRLARGGREPPPPCRSRRVL